MDYLCGCVWRMKFDRKAFLRIDIEKKCFRGKVCRCCFFCVHSFSIIYFIRFSFNGFSMLNNWCDAYKIRSWEREREKKESLRSVHPIPPTYISIQYRWQEVAIFCVFFLLCRTYKDGKSIGFSQLIFAIRFDWFSAKKELFLCIVREKLISLFSALSQEYGGMGRIPQYNTERKSVDWVTIVLLSHSMKCLTNLYAFEMKYSPLTLSPSLILKRELYSWHRLAVINYIIKFFIF